MFNDVFFICVLMVMMMENKCKISRFNNLILPCWQCSIRLLLSKIVHSCSMSCSRQRIVELWKNLRKTHSGDVARNKSSDSWRKYQKPERRGKTERNTGKLHTKNNKQVWSAFSATDSGRKRQVGLVFVPRIWKQAHNVWRQDWLLQSWLHDDQA